MAVEICELLQGVGLPEDNVTLFTATGYLFVLDGVNEAVDTFLMQVECSFLPIVKRL